MTFPEVNMVSPEVSFTYNARGQLLTRTEPTGIVTSFSYSTSNEELESIVHDYGTGRLNLTVSLDYDSVGNVASATDANGNETVAEYDDLRRRTSVTSPTPFEHETQFVYDDNSQLTQVKRETGDVGNPWQTVTYSYTTGGKLASVTDPLSHSLSYTYDDVGRLWKVTDAMSRVTEYAYNDINRLVSITDPGNIMVSAYTYTDNGSVETITDARDNSADYEYDGFDRLKKVTYADDTYVERTFNANSLVTSLLTRAGDSVNFTYDELNRLVEMAPDGRDPVSYEYDLSGRLVAVAETSTSFTTQTWGFDYDTAGRLIEASRPDSLDVSYEYDDNGNLTKLTYPDGYYVGREYDEMNRLSAIKLNGSTTPAAEFSYDALSRRTGLSLSNGAEVSYDYQADNRLTSLTQDFNGTDTVTFDYGYDAIGRLTSQDISDATYSWKPSASSTRTYGTANEVNQFPTVGGQSYGYSDNGMLTSDGVWTYSYDSTNRMESASKSGLSLSFENDPMNRLASFSDGSSTTKQVFSGGALIASYDGSNNLQSRTVFGASAAEPLLSVASGGAITTMHQDGLGSVIASTDSGGTVSNSKGFGSFGESSVSSGLSFGFAATPVVTGSALIGNSLNPSDGVGVGAAANPMGYNEAMQQLHSGLWWLMAAKGTGSDDDYGYSPPSEPTDRTKWGNGGTGGGNNSGHSYGGNSPGQLAPNWGTPDSTSPRNWAGSGSPFTNYGGVPAGVVPSGGSSVQNYSWAPGSLDYSLPYGSKDEAAKSVADRIRFLTVSTGKEWGAVIYSRNGSYFVGPLTQGEAGGVDSNSMNGWLPDGATVVS